jgi:tetratricopeptide (TPR) repeat protein
VTTRYGLLSSALLLLLVSGGCTQKPVAGHSASQPKPVAGNSSACRGCHPAFYKKWATSHHGQAMQPFTPKFASASLTVQPQPVQIGKNQYQVFFDESSGYIEERGLSGNRKLPMLHVMGGKNVYYFLTPLERGRLQVLPLAYDLHKKSWYDMAASGVRMHVGGPADAPLPWTDPAFTFNTSCYSCHVSQLKTNYDVANDSYNSTWKEPGINCESCHNDGKAHVDLYTHNKGEKVDDMRILRTTKFTTVQRNEMCAPCHAKMSPISPGYQVTQRFFDHYDLITLEDPDFYQDGRDLGENYTYTSWLRSPCVRAGKFDCIHCHTSSGRYRFATENPNGACLPCHQEKAANLEAHTHHKAGTPGGQCIDCHMPKTRFAAMNRSDHSMLPPTPAATLKYKSPNACNLCHKEKSAAWADAQVRKWHRDDYQKPVLDRAALIDAARRRDWKSLPQILAYIRAKDADPVFVASLIRLLVPCTDESKWPALLESLKHSSPLVRAAAAASITGRATDETRAALVQATRDEYRLVRIRSAASLAAVPVNALPTSDQDSVKKATEELLDAYRARPDDFANHTNLGNFYMERGNLKESIQSFETAIKQRPDSVGTLVNASMAYSRAGQTAEAERVLRQALSTAPNNAAANFNLGLLLAETNRNQESEAALRKALASDPTLDPAAFNLCVLISQRNRDEAISFCRQAYKQAPTVEKYAFTLAFYLNRRETVDEALRILKPFAARAQFSIDTRMLTADLLVKSGELGQATALYQSVLARPDLEPQQRQFVSRQLKALSPR